MSDNTKSVTADAYAEVRKYQNWAKQALWVSAIIIVITVSYSYLPANYKIVPKSLKDVAIALQIFGLLVYHTLSAYSSVLHYESGKKHFPDLMDNSFGSNLAVVQSSNYYRSIEGKQGAYQLAYNTTENCYFTMRNMQIMTSGMVIEIILWIAFFVVAILLNHNELFVTAIRITIPIVLFKKVAVFIYARIQIQNLFTRLDSLMRHLPEDKEFFAESLDILLHYETLIAWLNFPTSEEVYLNHKGEFNEEFAKIAKKFKV